MPTEMRQAAQDYLLRGWSVIPLEPGGKKPLISWKPYQTRFPSIDELDDWFADDGPNIGLVTGALSGIAVCDVDSHDAMRWALDYEHGQGLGEVATPLVETGKGWHVYYAMPPGLRNLQANPEWPGVDLRGEGGYVVAPPSVHVSGRHYTWALEVSLPLALMPLWMTKYTAAKSFGARSVWDGALPAVILPNAPPGRRNTTAASLAGHLIFKGMEPSQVLAMVQAWNQAGSSPLPADEIAQTVQSVFRTDARNRPPSHPFEGIPG